MADDQQSAQLGLSKAGMSARSSDSAFRGFSIAQLLSTMRSDLESRAVGASRHSHQGQVMNTVGFSGPFEHFGATKCQCDQLLDVEHPWLLSSEEITSDVSAVVEQ